MIIGCCSFFFGQLIWQQKFCFFCPQNVCRVLLCKVALEQQLCSQFIILWRCFANVSTRCNISTTKFLSQNEMYHVLCEICMVWRLSNNIITYWKQISCAIKVHANVSFIAINYLIFTHFTFKYRAFDENIRSGEFTIVTRDRYWNP